MRHNCAIFDVYCLKIKCSSNPCTSGMGGGGVKVVTDTIDKKTAAELKKDPNFVYNVSNGFQQILTSKYGVNIKGRKVVAIFDMGPFLPVGDHCKGFSKEQKVEHMSVLKNVFHFSICTSSALLNSNVLRRLSKVVPPLQEVLASPHVSHAVLCHENDNYKDLKQTTNGDNRGPASHAKLEENRWIAEQVAAGLKVLRLTRFLNEFSLGEGENHAVKIALDLTASGQTAAVVGNDSEIPCELRAPYFVKINKFHKFVGHLSQLEFLRGALDALVEHGGPDVMTPSVVTALGKLVESQDPGLTSYLRAVWWLLLSVRIFKPLTLLNCLFMYLMK